MGTALSTAARDRLTAAIGDPQFAKEVSDAIDNTGAPITIVATSGTLPTAAASVTVADAAVPTVAELLKLVVSLNARLNNSL